MDWIEVGTRMPECEDGSYQLVVYLKPFFGTMSEEVTIAYFDDPECLENPEDGEGWKDRHTDQPISVTHWQRLPMLPQGRFDGLSQPEFKRIFGSYRPNLGSVHSQP